MAYPTILSVDKTPRSFGNNGCWHRRNTSFSKQIRLYSLPSLSLSFTFILIEALEITFNASNSPSDASFCTKNTTPLAPRPNGDITFNFPRSNNGILSSSMAVANFGSPLRRESCVVVQYAYHHDHGRRHGRLESRSFENSYIPENPRTPKPLTFSKNRLRGAKNRSNISPVAKKNFRKNNFFFPKTLHICKKKIRAYVRLLRFCFKNAQIPEIFLKFVYRSLYTTYLKGFVKKNLKKNAKKKNCIYAKVEKKISFFRKKFSANFIHSKRFGGFRSRFFERNNGLGDIGNWRSSRMLVQMRTIIEIENGGNKYGQHLDDCDLYHVKHFILLESQTNNLIRIMD
ncbi:hypothetical protein LXL04_018644 [Taraxacum kok-saghyz]